MGNKIKFESLEQLRAYAAQRAGEGEYHKKNASEKSWSNVLGAVERREQEILLLLKKQLERCSDAPGATKAKIYRFVA